MKQHGFTWWGGGQKGEVGGSPLFFPCFCGGHGNYCREQPLLGYDTRATLSTLCSSRRAALAAGYCAQANQGASDPSRNSERLDGPGSSLGALCSVLASLVAYLATLGRAPDTGNPPSGCYGSRALQASSCTKIGRQEQTLVAGWTGKVIHPRFKENAKGKSLVSRSICPRGFLSQWLLLTSGLVQHPDVGNIGNCVAVLSLWLFLTTLKLPNDKICCKYRLETYFHIKNYLTSSKKKSSCTS